jgi:hypothetical protein
MNTDLHKQKVEILSRLIKENSLTLDEVLILLKEEQEVDNQPVTPSYIGTISDSRMTPEGSTWNSSVSYATYDETPTL